MDILFSIVLVLSLVGLMLYIMLILPLWLLIHCANSSRSSKQKTIWIICMVLTWPLASIAYGLFSSKKAILKWSSVFSLVLVSIAGGILIFGAGFVHEQTELQIVNVLQDLKGIDMPQLSEGESDDLKDALELLSSESQGDWLSAWQKDDIAAKLVENLKVHLEDGVLSPDEHKDWMGKFTQREFLNVDAL